MRIRFSLKTFLAIVAVAATCCGAARLHVLDVRAKADRHDLALSRLDGLGISHDSQFSFECGEKRSTYVRFARTWIHPHAYPQAHYMIFGEQGGCIQFGNWKWEQLCEHLDELKHLAGLRAISGDIKSLSLEQAKHFGAIKDVEDITLTVTGKIEPGALSEIAKGPRLKELKLFAQIDRPLIETIRDNRTLTKVQINGARLTPELMKILCNSSSIKNLCISNLQADAAMLDPLKNMIALKNLRIYNSQFTSTGIERLVCLDVKKLSISSEAELPTSVAVFANMTHLEDLSIDAECRRAPGDVESFANSRHLRRLSLPHFEIDIYTLQVLNESASLRYASFYGNPPESAAREFAEGGAGRWLFVTRKPPKNNDSLEITVDSWPKMYEGKNCGDLEIEFPADE